VHSAQTATRQQQCDDAHLSQPPKLVLHRTAAATTMLFQSVHLLPSPALSAGLVQPRYSSRGAELCTNSAVGANDPKLRDGLSQHLPPIISSPPLHACMIRNTPSSALPTPPHTVNCCANGRVDPRLFWQRSYTSHVRLRPPPRPSAAARLKLPTPWTSIALNIFLILTCWS